MGIEICACMCVYVWGEVCEDMKVCVVWRGKCVCVGGMGERCECVLTSMVSRPWLTAVRRRGSIVSRPGRPGGGEDESFSVTVWGAGRKGGEEGRGEEEERMREGGRGE